MIVAFCTKGYGVVFFIFLLKVAYLLLCFCPFVSFVNFFFRFTIFFSRALLRTFGAWGEMEKKGSMELDRWGDVAWDFQLVFFTCSLYLWFVRLLPWGLGCFFIPALKVVIFHLFVFRFFLISEKCLS